MVFVFIVRTCLVFFFFVTALLGLVPVLIPQIAAGCPSGSAAQRKKRISLADPSRPVKCQAAAACPQNNNWRKKQSSNRKLSQFKLTLQIEKGRGGKRKEEKKMLHRIGSIELQQGNQQLALLILPKLRKQAAFLGVRGGVCVGGEGNKRCPEEMQPTK